MRKVRTLHQHCARGAMAMAMVLTAAPAWAQPEQSGPDETPAPAREEGQEIVVQGIRASLQAAAEIKRDADQVVDVITAEDVGTLPDANVAEALQRVTGVQITRVFGEGQAVSVRGLQQVRVEVDGRTLLGWSARLSPPENDQLGRSSGLDSVPSSLFGRLEVRKSPLASQAEGGLGGTVNLVTPRPFDFRETTISARLQGTYSDVSDVFEPGATGLFTTRFADNRIGILIAAEYQERTSTIQSFERNNFINRNYTSTSGGVTTTVARPTPVLLQYENFRVDRSRLGISGALQFEVTPELVLTFDGIYSRLTTGRRQDFLSWRLPTTNNPVANAVVEDGFVVAGTANGTLQTAGQIRNEPTESTLVGANLEWDSGPWRIEADGYYSRGTIDQTIQIITIQGRAAVPGTFDFRDGTIPSLTLGTAAAPFDPTAFANYNPLSNGVRSNRLIGVLEEYTGRLDLEWDSGTGVTLSAGGRYTDLGARSNAFRSQTTRPRDEIGPLTGVLTGFLGDIPGNFPRVFLTTLPTFDYVFNTAVAAQPNPANLPDLTLLPNIQRDYDFSERTWAGYLMVSAEAEMFGIPVRANAGVRVAHTSLSVDTFLLQGTTFSPRTDENSYTNWLPSANVVFNVTDNFLVRVSRSKTLQRASIADLAPSLFFNQTNLSVTGGNAALRPPTSTQGDLSLEYYTGRSSLFSGAVFYKDVQDFITTINSQQIVPGLENEGPLQTSFPANVASARIYGFELGAQQFFDFLPAPLDGLGFIANYTYSNSRDDNGFPLVAVSRHSYNLIGLYERGRFKARVAYNYRSRALFEFTAETGGVLRPSYIGGRSQLDAQLSIELLEGIQLNLQAQNLSPADSATREYSVISTALNSYALSERRFTIGVRARY